MKIFPQYILGIVMLFANLNLSGQDAILVNGNSNTANTAISDCPNSTASIQVNFANQTDSAVYTINGANPTVLSNSGQSFNLNYGNAGSSVSLNVNYYDGPTINKTITISFNAYSNLSVGTVNNFGPSTQTNATLCFDTSLPSDLELSPTGGDGNYNYIWQKSSSISFNTSSVIVANSSSTLSSATVGNLKETTYIRSIVTDGCSNSSISGTYTIFVYDSLQLNGISLSGNNTPNTDVCFNDPLSANLVVNRLGGNTSSSFSYTWEKSSDASFSSPTTISTTSVNSLSATTIGPLTATTFFRATVTDNCGDVNTSPTFTANVYAPLSNATLYQESTVSASTQLCYNELLPFNLEASAQGGDINNPYTYSWQIDDNFGFSSPTVIGNNQSLLLPSQLGALSQTSYVRVNISDNCGDQITSSLFVINVYDELISGSLLNSGSNSSEQICFDTLMGGSLSFTPSGGNFNTTDTYAWYYSTNSNLSNPQLIPTSTSTSLSAVDLGNLKTTSYIWAETTDPGCNDISATSTYTINVYDSLQLNSLHLAGQTANSVKVCYNDALPANLVVDRLGGDVNGTYTYVWESSLDPGFSSPTVLSTGTTNTLNLSSNPLQDTTYYRASVSDACGDTETSATFIALVYDSLQAGGVSRVGVNILSSTAICYNELLGFDLEVEQSGGNIDNNFSYAWQIDTDPNFVSPSALGGNQATLSQNQIGQLTSTSYIRVIISDLCSDQDISGTYQIIVYDELISGLAVNANTFNNETVCFGRPMNGSISFNPIGGNPNTQDTYQWYSSLSPLRTSPQIIAGAVSTTLSSAQLGPLFDTTYVWAVTTDPGCADISATANYTIRVYDSLELNSVYISGQTANSAAVCFDASLPNSLIVDRLGGDLNNSFSYVWQKASNSAFNNPTTITTNSSNSLSAAIIGNLKDTTFFRAYVTDNCGDSDTSATFTALVYDSLQVNDLTQLNGSLDFDTLCYNSPLNFDLSVERLGGNISGAYSYQWQRSGSPNFTNVSIIATTASPTLSAATVGNLTDTTYIRVIATDLCNDQDISQTFSAFVYDSLQANSLQLISNGASSTTLCFNDMLASGLSVQQLGGVSDKIYTYTWQVASNPTFTNPTQVVNNSSSRMPSDFGAFRDTSFVRVIITDECSSDTSASFTINVYDSLQVNSLHQAGNMITSSRLCFNENLAFDLEVDRLGGDITGAYSYQWQIANNSNFANPTNFATTANNQISSGAIGSLNQTSYIRAIVSDDCGDVDTSGIYSVIVYDEHLAGSIKFNNLSSSFRNIDICYAESIGLEIDPNDAPLGGQADGILGDYIYQWQDSTANGNTYQDNSLASETGTSFIANADSLQPGTYYFRLRIEDSCSVVFTDAIEVLVEETPYWNSVDQEESELYLFAADGNLNTADQGLRLCDNQQNVLIRLNKPVDNSYNYTWSSNNSNTQLQADAGRPTFAYLLNIQAGSSALNLEIENPEQCERQVISAFNASSNKSPNAANVRPKNLNASNLMLAIENPTAGLNGITYYQWGRIDKWYGNLEKITSWDTLQFHDFTQGIDTNRYIYFVSNTNDTASPCRSYGYFPNRLNFIGEEEVELEQGFDFYPNPSDGNLFITGALDKIESVQAFNLVGQELAFNFKAKSGELQITHPVPNSYVLLVVRTQAQVFTYKILVK